MANKNTDNINSVTIDNINKHFDGFVIIHWFDFSNMYLIRWRQKDGKIASKQIEWQQ